MTTTRKDRFTLADFLKLVDIDDLESQIDILEYMDYGQFTSAPVKEITINTDGLHPVIQLSR